MATKKTKKRNKKYDVNKRSYVLSKSLANVWLLGGDCINGHHFGGTSFKKDRASVLEYPQMWAVRIFLFCKDTDTGKEFYEIANFEVSSPVWQKTFAALLEVKILEVREAFLLDERNADNDIISAGFLASPSLDADLDATIPQALDRFKDSGCFDALISNLSSEVNKDFVLNTLEKNN